jgi:hypothetical protein
VLRSHCRLKRKFGFSHHREPSAVRRRAVRNDHSTPKLRLGAAAMPGQAGRGARLPPLPCVVTAQRQARHVLGWRFEDSVGPGKGAMSPCESTRGRVGLRQPRRIGQQVRRNRSCCPRLNLLLQARVPSVAADASWCMGRNRAKQDAVALRGTKSTSRAEGRHRKLGDPASDQWHEYALVRIGKVRSRPGTGASPSTPRLGDGWVEHGYGRLHL